jgi:hypothetical protein
MLKGASQFFRRVEGLFFGDGPTTRLLSDPNANVLPVPIAVPVSGSVQFFRLQHTKNFTAPSDNP